MANKSSSQKTVFVLVAVVIVVVAVLLVVVLQQKPAADQGKITSIPTEIKSQSEAANLEKDTSKILSEVQGTLTDLDKSLPDV